MKKKSLLFTLTAGLAFIILSSNDNGPFANGNGNHTGSTGAGGNCSGTGCHASNNTNTTIAIVLLDGSTPVATYQAGKTYTVQIGGTNTSANLPKFGFQATCVKAATPGTQAGTLATGGTSGIALRSTTSPNLIEHTTPLSGTGTGTNWAYNTTFKWTAPPTATVADSVRFYLTLNAVNGTGSETGDQPNNVTATFGYSTSSVGTIANNTDLMVYPNPATDAINVHFGNAMGTYTVNAFDLRGKMIASQQADVNTNNREVHINSEKWASGSYMLQISKDGEQKVFPFVKE